MRDQLQAGCRYIDLDVCKLMGDRYSGDASFYTAHSVCAVRVTDVIEEILAFVASHAGEIVVVNLVTQCDRFRTEPEVTIEFAALVKRQFGDAVHPAALAMKTTYENILASGKRLLLLSSNDALVEASGGLIGSANVIAGTFVDTDDLATKQAGLYQQLQQYEPDNDSYQLSYTLTAQESDIRNDAILRYVFCCLGPCRRNRGNMALADEINPTLTTFVNGLTAEMRGKIGYITVDDFVNTDNVQAAIALNTERASAPSASGAGVANGASPSEQQSVPPNTSASTFNVEAGPSSVDASSSEQQSVLPDTSAITFTAEAGPSSVDAMIITQQPTATSVTPPPVGPIVTLSTISMSTV
eukprot:Opistho-2@82699